MKKISKGTNTAKVVLCIPTYNERENINRLIPIILGILDEYNINGLILVIDDNSPDGTSKIVQEWIQRDHRVQILSRPKKTGLGSAYRAGFRKALDLEADVIFEMDSDFSHDPQMIPAMLQSLRNSELVVGSRKVEKGGILGWGFRRTMVSWGANMITHVLLRLRTRDVTSGFRAIRATALREIDLERMKTEGYAFQIELLYLIERVGRKRVTEVPIVFVDRVRGQSKLGMKDIIEFAAQVFRLFLRRASGRLE
ncbi:MAG: polyprenol monophosphomannose synthase [Candidatus Hodarchaeales archaeon]